MGARWVESSDSIMLPPFSSLCAIAGASGACPAVGRFNGCETETGISWATRVELAVLPGCVCCNCVPAVESASAEVGAGTGTGTGLSPCEATGATRRRGKYRQPTRTTVKAIVNWERSGERRRRMRPSQVPAAGASSVCRSCGCATMEERIRRKNCFHRFGLGRWKLLATIESASRRK